MDQTKATHRTVPLKSVKIDAPFWTKYEKLVREVVIPYQYEALHDRVQDAEPSYAIRNFEIAAGRKEGEFGGMVFQDSDVAKWLEAVGYSLATHPDPELERIADEVIDLVAEAQQPDGYLNTYFTIKEPDKRWTNLTECHELYCAGHMMEAAVAYYQGTGKRKLLDVMCRYADYIGEVFGPDGDQIRGYDGHQEVELALVKLYGATGERRYLELAKFFIEERGRQPNFFEREWERLGGLSFWNGRHFKLDLKYHQAHAPVREQYEAVGHAVRAVYMYAGMADLAALTGDRTLYDACVRLWNNTVRKQMYITGGIGSNAHREAFSVDYDLPNDTVYAETCASIGLVFWAQRMLKLEPKREYADVMERALYNTVVSGMSQDGKHYFYVNPLEVWPKACRHNPTLHHVKPERQPWFGCACCPPNLARLVASLGEYIYTTGGDTVYAHLYVGGDAELVVGGGSVRIRQETNYPWEGAVKLTVSLPGTRSFGLGLRIPSWAEKASLRVNGEVAAVDSILEDGYAVIRRTWSDGDTVELELPMTVKLMQAHPQVRADAGKAAIQRGPLVYCLEEIDNGAPVSSLSIPLEGELRDRFDPELLGGCAVIEGTAYRDDAKEWGEELYRPAAKRAEQVPFRAVPYFLWGNRGQGDMAVWVRVR